jgi:DNA-binding transcriptional LysR family regulator
MAPRPPDSNNNRISGRVKLRDLHILSIVVQFGSMAKAASHLAITQPSVSEAIANLEHAVGVRLLDRGPRGIMPTIYGDALLKRGLEAFDSLNQGMRDIEFLSKPGAGQVWIGCGEALLGGFVLAVIQRLAIHRPDVIVHATQASASDFDFELLRERKVDLMLGRKLLPNVDDDLSIEMLFEERLVVVVGARHRWANRRKIVLADLSHEKWIFSEPSNVVQSIVSEVFRANGLEFPKAAVVTPSMNLRLSLLTTGQYVTTFPSSLMQFGAAQETLRTLPINFGAAMPCGLITLKNRILSPVAHLFIENARSVAKQIAK